MIDRRQVVAGAIGVCVGFMLTVAVFALNRRMMPAPIVIVPPPPTPTAVPTQTPGPIRVFVNGAVAVPAVYQLPPDSIVAAAVEKAGGFAANANTAVVNLAQPLRDGAQVYVPTHAEVTTQPAGGVHLSSVTEAAADREAVLISLNTADVETLQTLPGIGPSLAQAIVDYREEEGPFDTIESVMHVPGIGQAKFEQIRAYITVEE